MDDTDGYRVNLLTKQQDCYGYKVLCNKWMKTMTALQHAYTLLVLHKKVNKQWLQH